MTGREALTLAELVEQVRHLGGDPATTTFSTWTGPVYAADHDIDRENGALVIDLGGDIDEEADEIEDLKTRLVAAEVELDRQAPVIALARALAAAVVKLDEPAGSLLGEVTR